MIEDYETGLGKRQTELLKSLRKNLKLTQKEVAVRVGISPAVISQYECGEVKPRLETATMLAEVLGCSVEDIFGKMESPSTKRKQYNRVFDAIRN